MSKLFVSISFAFIFFMVIMSTYSLAIQDTVSSGKSESVVIETSHYNDTEAEGGEKKDASVPEGPPAMKVHIDPETGEFLEGPPDIAPEGIPIEKDAVITSPEELEEVESDIPGGGVMIDLKGRFRNYQKAVKDSDGNTSIECDDAPHISPSGNAEKTGQGKE